MSKEKPDAEIWKKYPINPDEAIGEDERTVWMELQFVIHDLLLELKIMEKLNKVY